MEGDVPQRERGTLWMVWDERDTSAPLLESEDMDAAAQEVRHRTVAGSATVFLECPLDGEDWFWRGGYWQPRTLDIPDWFEPPELPWELEDWAREQRKAERRAAAPDQP